LWRVPFGHRKPRSTQTTGYLTKHSGSWGSTIGLAKPDVGARRRTGFLGLHTIFGNLKTWLRGTFHGVSPKHLQRYLNEFVFRFNQRWDENKLFSRVLLCAIDTGPSPYHRLTAERTG
jgi:hypothetical protein